MLACLQALSPGGSERCWVERVSRSRRRAGSDLDDERQAPVCDRLSDARFPLAQTRVTNIRVSAVGPWASATVTIYRAARSSRGDAFVRNLYRDLLLMSVAALSGGSVEPDP
jgi:hypothetical protein